MKKLILIVNEYRAELLGVFWLYNHDNIAESIAFINQMGL